MDVQNYMETPGWQVVFRNGDLYEQFKTNDAEKIRFWLYAFAGCKW